MGLRIWAYEYGLTNMGLLNFLVRGPAALVYWNTSTSLKRFYTVKYAWTNEKDVALTQFATWKIQSLISDCSTMS